MSVPIIPCSPSAVISKNAGLANVVPENMGIFEAVILCGLNKYKLRKKRTYLEIPSRWVHLRGDEKAYSKLGTT